MRTSLCFTLALLQGSTLAQHRLGEAYHEPALQHHERRHYSNDGLFPHEHEFSEHTEESEHENRFPYGQTQQQQPSHTQQRQPQQQAPAFYVPGYQYPKKLQQPGPILTQPPTSHEVVERQFVQVPTHEQMPYFAPYQARQDGIPDSVGQVEDSLSFLKDKQQQQPPLFVAPSEPSSPAMVPQSQAVQEHLVQKVLNPSSDQNPAHGQQPITPSQKFSQGHHPAMPPVPGMKSCWMKTRFRDVGEMVSMCSPGLEKADDLCYEKCKHGYEGVSENCWSECPGGFKSNGSYCMKPKSLGKGWGSSKQQPGFEKYGLLWYPQCPKGYHSVGCCICSPDCPPQMGDAGLQCQKDSYSRPNPHPMICPHGKEQEGFMCYEPCGYGQSGIHNVCWGQCPLGTEQCGVLCLAEGEVCTAYIASIGKDTLASVLAQERHSGNSKRGQASNDLELNELQEEVYNNTLQLSLTVEGQEPEILNMGPGMSYPICETFM